MKFKFDANQDYQLQAINAVVDLFEGQVRIEPLPTFALGGLAAVPNRLDLDETALLENLWEVQQANGISVDEALEFIELERGDGKDSHSVRPPNFSVEMETGTGKTYIYLRTILELNRRYGFLKFIIVVPSVAIREGVLKTLAITREHFLALYDNQPYRYYEYQSDNLSQVRQFALNNQVEIMVMTIDSFNKAGNVIYRSTDWLQGETPVHLIQAAHPILILDEPQNMETETAREALSQLNPLMALRYSATHRNPYNLVYRLTPAQAYNDGLVKRIEVASVVQHDDYNRAFIQLKDIKVKKTRITARVTVHKRKANGTVQEKTLTIKPGDSLLDKTDHPIYKPFVVDEINPGGQFIRFSNGIELSTGEATGEDREAIFRAQIAYTIEEHFRKQRRLSDQGIKVLSLFFIDQVDNYVDGGPIYQFFIEAFEQLKSQYPEWEDADPGEVQGSYFSRYKTEHHMESDTEAFDLIMRDKERLLSLDEPTSFIFSHSALREGWDNPNVFQICTLNQTISNIKKRQEIGRGVRLAVNQSGERVKDQRINILTVTANESYQEYAARLQSEYEADYPPGEIPPPPPPAQRVTVRRSKERYLSSEFKELWERIKHKTRYAVSLDTDRLISECAAELKDVEIREPRIRIEKAQIEMAGVADASAIHLGGGTDEGFAGRYPVPNIIERVKDETHLNRATVLEIFKQSRRAADVLVNPHDFIASMIRVIKARLQDLLIDGIQYQKINEWYEMTLFDEEYEQWEKYLVPADKSVYDHVEFDSAIEEKFAHDLEQRPDVKLYVKLPGWFTVLTPVGEYNPDWAIVFEEHEAHGEPLDKPVLYLVRETKGTTNLDELRPDEKRKVQCGAKHFEELGVSYKIVTSAAELP